MRRVRARDFGVEIGAMKPGKHNAITDVEGVGVGHCTIIEGKNIRTGVTAILPHQGNFIKKKVTAAVDLFNPYGKATGSPQIMSEENLESPIMLTETLNTWKVADALVDYMHEVYGETPESFNAVVGETNGGYLTNNYGRHVNREHVFRALDAARNCKGPVEEGCVGGGTPMIGYGLKGGIGTASRVNDDFTLGVLVQLNCGRKDDLLIDGVPVGRELTLLEKPTPSLGNSIMMIIATDIEMTSRQLQKVAKRAIIGLARTGSNCSNSSGDFSIAFTTGQRKLDNPIKDLKINPLYRANIEATEEAIINALLKAETMTGKQGRIRYALPYDQLETIFEKYGRTI